MPPQIPTSHQIQTPRFVLRIPNEADIPFVFSATRFEGFNDGMVWDPPEKQEELIEPLLNNKKAWEAGKGYSFTITEKKRGEPLGKISIRKTDQENRWNVGFWTHPESQKQGIMTEALKGILGFGFEELSATEIEACHALWNKASEKVLLRNGMIFERYVAEGFKKNGEWIEENLLVINREQWNKIN